MSAKYNQIISFLDQMQAEYEVVEHKPVTTSREAEAVTGHTSAMGAKSIVFKTGSDFILVVLQGSKLADFQKIRFLTEQRKARLATPEEVLDVMGVAIGACYPFGSVAGINMIVDRGLANNMRISFSPGVHHKHIVMPWTEYKRVVQPELVDIVRN